MNASDINLFPLFLSLKVAFTATLLSVVIGIPVAYFLSRSEGRAADLADSLLTLPVVLPPTVLGYYLLVLLGRQSVVGRFLEDNFQVMIVFTPAGAVVAAMIVSLPFLVKTARTAFAAIDKDLIDAARLLGRTDFNIFFAVLFPLAWRGILSGTVLAFARALGDFGTTLMVAGNIPGKTVTMPIAIYDALLAGNKELADLLVIIMTVVAFSVLFILNRLEKNMLRS
ncbi:MAG: molybdate ABC transporter permease subunit [Negativicutes bacterium]|nr:molybdate ABC transporter permease subunit [Negativicutes bacterium]